MGVPKFFRWISERYPKINQPLNCDPSVETYAKYFEHDGTPKTIDFSTNNNNNIEEEGGGREEIIDPNVPEFDNLYIDMNGVIHGCSHANNSQKSDNDDDTKEEEEEEEENAITEEEIFANICYYLDRVVSDIVKPKKVLYLAIDGVAPRAKLNQQRARRFKAGKEAEVAREQAKQEEMDRKEQQYDLSDDSSGSSDDDEEEEEEEDGVLILSSDSTTTKKKKRGEEGDTAEQDSEFHHNSITPGTPFLQKCSDHIQNFVRYKLQEEDPDGVSKWKHLKIYFSGPNVPGEGEHKIMHYIRRQKRLKQQQELEKQTEGGGVSLLDLDVPPQSPTRHCLMGQDGDLIMLGLATHEPNFCLLRERVTFGRQNKAPSTQMRNPSGFNHTQNKAKVPILEYIHNTNFELLQLNVLRDYLALEFNASTTPTAQHHDDENSRKYAQGEYVERPTYDLERTIDDFVFMTFFIGNDFLPHLPALDIADGAFDVLFMTYKKHRDRWWFGSMKRKASSTSTVEKNSTMNANGLYFTDNGSIVSGRRLENFLVDIGRHEDPYYEWKKKIEMKIYAQARDSDIKYGRTPSIPSEQELEDLELKKRLKYKEMMEKIALEAIGDTKNQKLFDYNDESDDGEEEDDEDDEEDSLDEEDTNQAHANGRRNRRRRGRRASSTSNRRRNRRPVLTSKTSFTIKSSNSTDSTQMGASTSTQDEEEEKGMFSKLKKLLNESLSLTAPSSSSSNTNNTSHSTKHLELDEAHMDDLKGRYYYDKFQFTPLDLDKHYRLRKKYIEGLVWCLKYYYHGCISWSWYYPYHYGPMKSDLRNLKPILKSISFGYGGPFLPFTQLLACMPPTNAHLLPKPFQFLMLPPSPSDGDDNGAKVSPILEYYPTDFEIDMNGKRNPWEMVVKLPFIDSKRLNNAVSEHVDFNLLTPDEKKRNSIEDTLVYYYNNDTVVGGKEEKGMVEKIVSEENLYNRKPNRSKLQQQQELPLRSNSNNSNDSDDSSLTLPSSSLFLKNTQMIQPGFSTLNSVPISQLDREKIALNIFGTRSRYNTCVLKMEDFMYSILPSAKVLAPKFIGTQIFYNYPHFSEAFVTAVSDSHGIQRGGCVSGANGANEYRKWNTSESDLWKQNSMRLYKQYLFGENKVGSGGWHLPTETANSPDHAAASASGGGVGVLGEGTSRSKNNNDNNTSHTKNSYTMKKSSYYRRNPGITQDTKNIILTVRPLKGLVEGKYKIYHRDEINIPFFAALWTPEKMDPRFLGVQARLEKNPFRLVQPNEEPCLMNHVPLVSKKKKKSKPSSNATTKSNRKNNNKWSAEEKQQNNNKKKKNNKKENIHLKGISLKHLNLDSQKTPLSNTSNSSSFLPPLGKDMRGRQFSSIACYNTPSSFLLKKTKQNDGMRIMRKSNFSTTTPSSSSLMMMKKGNLCTKYYSNKRSTIGFAAATTALLMFSNVFHTAQGSHYPRHQKTLATTTTLETSSSVSFLKKGTTSLQKSFSFSNIFEVSRGGSGDFFNYNDNEGEHESSQSSSRVPPLEFFHGTTTLSFLFQGGIICAVDSRASMGNFVGSKTTQKVLPISKYILGTMAGGAADCSFWIRKLQSYANMYSLNSSSAAGRMSVAKASRMLSNYMYQATQNKMDLSVGTMIMGFDSSSQQQEGEIYYIDQTGMRLNGDLFAVGSGSTFALGILDSLYTREERYSLSEHEAIELGIKAIRYATFRDAFSGGYIGVYLITKKDGWRKVFSEDLAATNTLSSLSSSSSSSSLNNTQEETNSK